MTPHNQQRRPTLVTCLLSMSFLGEVLAIQLHLGGLCFNVGESTRAQPCWACRDIPLKYAFKHATDSTGPRWVKLGSYEDIQKRRSCPICRLVLSLLSQGAFVTPAKLDAENMAPRNKGCILSASEEYGQMDLLVYYCGETRGRIKLLTEENYKDTIRQAHNMPLDNLKNDLRKLQSNEDD